jgi:amidase
MMRFDEYRRHDATGLASLVRAGEITADELLKLAQARLVAVEPHINAVPIRMAEQARSQMAAGIAGPFAGVPFLIKDISQDYAGVPTTMGSRALRDWRPNEHAETVRRFLAAGLVIFGKTATPELALKGRTESLRWGATRNPWNLGRTPGGSSGGAAAAVAAGIVPMAGANDGGGSIRIPAACCGLFGLRPSRGRVPSGPAAGEIWEGASSDHVLTRSVRDSAAMLDCLQGADIGAPFVIDRPDRTYSEIIGQPPPRLRIALCTRSPLGLPVDAQVAAATERTARLLESLGHSVDLAEPEIDGAALARSYLMMYFGQVAATISEVARLTGAPETEFEAETRVLGLLGRTVSAGEYVERRRQWNSYARALGHFFERYDLYLTPSLASPPQPIGSDALPAWQQRVLTPVLSLGLGRLLIKSGIVETLATESLRHVPFTQLSNLTGTPSMSVPLHQGSDGLPIGSHFVAPFGREDRLLQVAAQLEQAAPWFDRVPPEPFVSAA